MLSIGYEIQQKRRKNNLTQAELARRAGLPQPNLSNIEKGRQDLTVSTLIRIAQALDVSPAEFFPRIEPPALGFTRERVEKLAEAVWSGAKLPREEAWIVERLRLLLPDAPGRSGARASEKAWFDLRRRYGSNEVKLLFERARDARRRISS